ncbi:MAG: phenylalanine--tRNA ligase subunit alpha, partial [Flavisolibacter sp.]
MEELLQQIDGYRKEIAGFEISNPQQLEEYRIKYLGTKGLVKQLFGEMRNVPNEKKKEFGQILNDFKQFAEDRYENGKEGAGGKKPEAAEEMDLTLPGDALPMGSRHPITLVRNRIVSIFQRL